jgi:hypothetical protein
LNVFIPRKKISLIYSTAQKSIPNLLAKEGYKIVASLD